MGQCAQLRELLLDVVAAPAGPQVGAQTQSLPRTERLIEPA
jgi:hypothetical protein